MSRIEQIITEIEDYIDSCKFQPLSNTKILVNKEEMEELLVELRMRIPEEIKKYQKIISNQDAILSEARSQADSMLAEATAQTNELVNEHEIMQRAYAEANSVVEQAQAQAESILVQANAQAQAIVDNAVNEANALRQGSVQYTDEMLKSLQTIIKHSMDGAQGRFDAFMSSMQSSFDIVTSNRGELAGNVLTEAEEADEAAAAEMTAE